MKITASTDPKTIMFEGHPDIEISRIATAPPEVFPGITRFYVYIGNSGLLNGSGVRPGNNHAYTEDGLDHGKDKYSAWPKLVLRQQFTADQPIVATSNSSSETFTYEHVGTYTPADGSEPRIRLRRTTRDGGFGNEIDVYASTGRVVSGAAGSSLLFTNAPAVTSNDHMVDGVMIRLTKTNGIATAVEIIL